MVLRKYLTGEQDEQEETNGNKETRSTIYSDLWSGKHKDVSATDKAIPKQAPQLSVERTQDCVRAISP